MALKPHAKLTSTLCVLLKLTIGLQVIAVLVGFFDFYSYSRLPLDMDIYDVVVPSDGPMFIVGMTQIVVGIVIGITFLRWIYRSNKNLSVLAGDYITFSPAWSIGWYFVPIFNFWKPYEAMKEIWAASHKGDVVDQYIVGWWWGLFLASGFLNRLTFRLSARADDVLSYNNATLVQIAADGAGIALSIVALMMVSRIGAAYSENFGDVKAN